MLLNDLIPKDKYDTVSVQNVIRTGFPDVQPILPELLIWIQDMNWPVAKELAPFLATIGEPLESELRKILKSDDEIWKYWILREIITKSPKLISKLRVELLQIAESPSEGERLEELHLIANDILQFPK